MRQEIGGGCTTQKLLLREHVLASVNPEILRLIRLATHDLYFGPIGPTDDDGQPWPGFAESCRQIGDALDLSDRWVCVETDEVRDTEPDWTERMEPDEGETEGPLAYWPADWWHYETRQVRRAVLGELAEYV